MTAYELSGGAYPGLSIVNRLGVFYPPDRKLVPRRVPPSPPDLICQYPFIHLGGERLCPRTQHNIPRQGSNLDSLIWDETY